VASFQCSRHASTEGIIGIFKHCATFQQKQDLEKFVSVVVLDEVGLAEDSENMPLKVNLAPNLNIAFYDAKSFL